MTKYITRRDGQWFVVNANAKKSTKKFETQKEAVLYASKMPNTSNIIIQGTDSKFRRLNNWDLKENGNTSIVRYVPRYVYKYSEVKPNYVAIVLLSIIIATTFLFIIFFSLYLTEVV